jgi:carbon dioxide concentrating mechanism protein CcmN
MSVPPLQLRPISTTHYYSSGDVTIYEGAVIAPGVLIQADPNSRIIIKAGACIGIGTILHAHNGLIEVGEGANVGAEVLLIGQVSIGAHACIGTASTILNSPIAAHQIVPPGSLIGDASRSATELQVTDTIVLPPSTEPEPTVLEAFDSQFAAPEAAEPPPPTENSGVKVYGQMYVNQLLVKMFPNSARSTPPPANPSLAPELSPENLEDPWDE